MRKIREVLRLRAEGFSEREIARSVGCARSSVQICVWRAEKSGVSWPLPPEQDEATLEAFGRLVDARIVRYRPSMQRNRLAALDCLTANDHPTLGEVDLLAQLGHHVPLAAVGANKRGRDELRADVRLGELLLVHAANVIGILVCF